MASRDDGKAAMTSCRRRRPVPRSVPRGVHARTRPDPAGNPPSHSELAVYPSRPAAIRTWPEGRRRWQPPLTSARRPCRLRWSCRPLGENSKAVAERLEPGQGLDEVTERGGGLESVRERVAQRALYATTLVVNGKGGDIAWNETHRKSRTNDELSIQRRRQPPERAQ